MLAIGLLLVLASISTGEERKTAEGAVPRGLEVGLRVVRQQACGEPESEVVSLWLELEARFTNRGADRMILPRRGSYEISSRIARRGDGGQRQLLFAPNIRYLYPPQVRIPVGKHPDRQRFVVLKSGGSHTQTVGTSLFIDRRGDVDESKAGLLRPGSRVELQLELQTWPADLPGDLVPTLAERWSGDGDLVAGVILSDYVPIAVPSLSDVDVCVP
jgi:hypothetical protein